MLGVFILLRLVSERIAVLRVWIRLRLGP
jgi:hypothetical protein